MAKIVADVIVQNAYTNDNDQTYYSVVDMETGGLWSFSLDGKGKLEGDVKGGTRLLMDATVNVNRVNTKKGVQTFITVLDGTFTRR